MRDMYILKKNLTDKTLSDAAFCIWAVLQPFSSAKDPLLLSYRYIAYLLCNREATRAESEFIKSGFEELTARGNVKIVKKLGNAEFVCDITGLYFQTGEEFFAVVQYEELHRIMAIDTKTDKCKLFRYYASIVGCFNHSKNLDEKYRGKVCGISLESINPLIPRKTALRYNEVLEENELLYVFRFDDILLGSDGQSITRIPNTYGRYRDRELCKSFAIHYQSTYGWNHKKESYQADIEKANQRRSLAQKYANMVKGKTYDDQTVKEVYEWAVEWNRKHRKAYDDEIAKGYEAELIQKDMSMFDKYLNNNCIEKETVYYE